MSLRPDSASLVILSGAIAQGAGTPKAFNRSIANRTVQATVTGTGTVTATVNIEVSNDGTNFIVAGTITLSGTTTASDGFAMNASWLNVRANVTAISGTNATVTVTVAT